MQFFKDLLSPTEKVGVAVILYTIIQEVSKSNLGPCTGYLDLYFVVLCKLRGLIPGCALIGHTYFLQDPFPLHHSPHPTIVWFYV